MKIKYQKQKMRPLLIMYLDVTLIMYFMYIRLQSRKFMWKKLFTIRESNIYMQVVKQLRTKYFDEKLLVESKLVKNAKNLYQRNLNLRVNVLVVILTWKSLSQK